MSSFQAACQTVCDCVHAANRFIHLRNDLSVDENPRQAVEAIVELQKTLLEADCALKVVLERLTAMVNQPTDSDSPPKKIKPSFHERGFQTAKMVYFEVFRAANGILDEPISYEKIEEMDPTCLELRWSLVKPYLEEECPTFSAKLMVSKIQEECARIETYTDDNVADIS